MTHMEMSFGCCADLPEGRRNLDRAGLLSKSCPVGRWHRKSWNAAGRQGKATAPLAFTCDPEPHPRLGTWLSPQTSSSPPLCCWLPSHAGCWAEWRPPSGNAAMRASSRTGPYCRAVPVPTAQPAVPGPPLGPFRVGGWVFGLCPGHWEGPVGGSTGPVDKGDLG